MSPMASEFQIETIAGDELALAPVLALAARNKKTLGFLPDEAFRQRADRNTLLVLRAPGGSVAGYVLADRTRRQVVLRQLCIDKSFRSRGGAHRLVDAVIERW